MKNNITILLLMSVFVVVSCSTTRTTLSDNRGYKITKIENNDFLYIIDVTRNDSTFKVVSLKEDFEGTFEKIKTGGKYSLNLLQLYPNEVVESKDNEAKNNPKNSCFISIDKKVHYRLYVASNLKGLSLSSNSDTEDIMNRFGVYTIFCDACKDKDKFLFRLFVK